MGANNNYSGAEKRYLMAQRITYTLLAIILFIYGLIAVRNFLYPIAFGFLLSYLFFPVANWLEKNRVPRILANLIVIISGLGLLVSLGLIAYGKISPVAGDVPGLIEKGLRSLADTASSIGGHFGFDRNETRTLVREQASNLMDRGGDFLQEVFTATTSTIVSIGLLPVYIFLFLYYRTKFAYFLLMIFGREHRQELIVIMREISQVFSRYLAGVFVVVLILCVVNSLGLWIIGLRYAIALGIISALINFIPYFGTLLGGIVPLFFALVAENDPALAFKVVILFIIIQFLENNILTPNIVGGNVRVNPFFIITGLVAASIVWGIPGMLLIVPFLAIVRIVFAHIEVMKPYDFLLGDQGTAKHAINRKNTQKFFRKIIGGKKNNQSV